MGLFNTINSSFPITRNPVWGFQYMKGKKITRQHRSR